jgi:hypothetical protein
MIPRYIADPERHLSLYGSDRFTEGVPRAQISRRRPQDTLGQQAGWQPTGGITVQTSTFRNPLTLGVIASVALLALQARADDEHSRYRTLVRLPTGQYITPTAMRGAVQQPLNPGLPDYPDCVAGEAVRSQLSPDGTTLAIICAGQNSLYKADGTLDTANSTQYIFLYNVAGANRARPVLSQVIQQPNAHVGLVFAPDGGTLYAAGGNDDAVYAYTRSGDAWSLAAKIALGHKTSTVVNAGVGLSVQPNASGLGISADGKAGTGNHASTDAPFGIQQGYIFNAVLQAGKTVRNYGFLVNNIGRICNGSTDNPPCPNSGPVADPFSAGIIQVAPLDPALAPLTDIYFRRAGRPGPYRLASRPGLCHRSVCEAECGGQHPLQPG